MIVKLEAVENIGDEVKKTLYETVQDLEYSSKKNQSDAE